MTFAHAVMYQKHIAQSGRSLGTVRGVQWTFSIHSAYLLKSQSENKKFSWSVWINFDCPPGCHNPWNSWKEHSWKLRRIKNSLNWQESGCRPIIGVIVLLTCSRQFQSSPIGQVNHGISNTGNDAKLQCILEKEEVLNTNCSCNLESVLLNIMFIIVDTNDRGEAFKYAMCTHEWPLVFKI